MISWLSLKMAFDAEGEGFKEQRKTVDGRQRRGSQSHEVQAAHGFRQFGKERLGISETKLAISSSAEDTEVKAMRSLWMSET